MMRNIILITHHRIVSFVISVFKYLSKLQPIKIEILRNTLCAEGIALFNNPIKAQVLYFGVYF